MLEPERRSAFPFEPRLWDVLVIGGGPAGSSAALVLAHAGCRVLLLEASRYDSFRVGETLPPSCKLLLQTLGIWDSFIKAGHLPSPGIVSLWGSDKPYANDFVFNPYGSGWHLDRRRFDAMITRAAASAGAKVARGWTVAGASFHRAWSVVATKMGEHVRLEANFLIDAAGRTSWRGRESGPRRMLDRLVAIVKVIDRSRAATIIDQRTLIEACADGWWYSAAIPGGGAIAAFFTDSDLVASAGAAKRWRDSLALAPRTRARLRNGKFRSVGVFPASSTIVCHPAGEHWSAVGDAVCTFDPLSSQGLPHALASGIEAADAILRDDLRPPSRSTAYVERARQRFESYWQARRYYYQQETRWSESLFWRRRHNANVLHARGPHDYGLN